MKSKQNYATMTKDELIQCCIFQDDLIEKYFQEKESDIITLCKQDIMEIYKCENNKALRILKLLFQMGYGNKIGKEYYVTKNQLNAFMDNMIGKEVFI